MPRGLQLSSDLFVLSDLPVERSAGLRFCREFGFLFERTHAQQARKASKLLKFPQNTHKKKIKATMKTYKTTNHQPNPSPIPYKGPNTS